MSSIRAIKDGNMAWLCRCLFVMKAKSNKCSIVYFMIIVVLPFIYIYLCILTFYIYIIHKTYQTPTE